MLVYRMDILKTLKDNGYGPARLRKEGLLGENAIQALRCGKMVGIKSLEQICGLLDAQPGTIIRYVPDPPSGAEH